MIGEVLGPIKAWSKGKPRSVKTKTDNFVFRLHYKLTSLIFLSASAVLISNQLFGDPISCFNQGSDHVEDGYRKTIDTMCWVTSLFSVKEHLCAKIGTEAPYAGVGILTPNHTPFDVQVTYRFLFFILFLQGISFYLPHLIWKSWESDKMKMLSAGLEHPLLDRNRKAEILHNLTDYLLHGQLNGSIKYAFHLHFCEMMNLVITGVNIWITDYFLRNEFIGYGLKAIGDIFKSSSSDNFKFDSACSDPVKALFPKVAKCTMYQHGPSGNVENHDYVCILPLNDFNILFFKFIWVWFTIILFGSIFWLLLRSVTFYSCKVRSFLLSKRAGTLPPSASHSHDTGTCTSYICSKISYADWVMIMQLGYNMDPLTYKFFLEYFCHQLYMKESGKQQKMIDKIYYSPV